MSLAPWVQAVWSSTLLCPSRMELLQDATEGSRYGVGGFPFLPAHDAFEHFGESGDYLMLPLLFREDIAPPELL